MTKIISDKIWAIMHSISKSPLVFLGLIIGLYMVYEVYFPYYYHFHIDSSMDNDYVHRNCMTRQYRANNCMKPPLAPHQNQQEPVCLEDINETCKLTSFINGT